MKMTLRPKGIYLGDGLVYKIRSISDPLSVYFTVLIPHQNEADEILCSCKGFQNHKKCWHVDALANGDWDDD